MTEGSKNDDAGWLAEHMVERVKQLEAELRTAKENGRGRRGKSKRKVRTLARNGPEWSVLIDIRAQLIRRHARGEFGPWGKPVTTDELLEIHRTQGGLCHYTGLPYEFGAGSGPLDVCADRLDPEKGWGSGNVVLCARFAAVARNGWPLSLVVPLWRFLPTKVE